MIWLIVAVIIILISILCSIEVIDSDWDIGDGLTCVLFLGILWLMVMGASSCVQTDKMERNAIVTETKSYEIQSDDVYWGKYNGLYFLANGKLQEIDEDDFNIKFIESDKSSIKVTSKKYTSGSRRFFIGVAKTWDEYEICLPKSEIERLGYIKMMNK